VGGGGRGETGLVKSGRREVLKTIPNRKKRQLQNYRLPPPPIASPAGARGLGDGVELSNSRAEFSGQKKKTKGPKNVKKSSSSRGKEGGEETLKKYPGASGKQTGAGTACCGESEDSTNHR